jgi:GxxExxY protein
VNSPQRTRRYTEENLNTVSGMIVDAAMKVHSALGPGLLESAYEICLKHELVKRGVEVKSQVELPVCYDGIQLDVGYRIDLLVADEIVVELKSVDKIAPIHEAQLLSYLKLSNRHVGLLINFNVVHLKDGIKRMVNRFQPLRSSASSAVK